MTADVETVLSADADAATDAEFDETTHTWTVRGRRARVVIASDGTLPTALADQVGGLRPYLGLATHGAPNYFMLTGPDAAAQKGYIAKCLSYMDRTDSTRIEVWSGTQHVYNERSRGGTHRGGHYWRRVGRRIPSAFEVRSHDVALHTDDEVYDGPATVVIAERRHEVRVRLTGRMDPIDGHYHWQGTIFDTGFDTKLPQSVTVVVGDRSAAGRLTERTPWSTFSVVGQGSPPFALDDIDVDVPLL